MPIYEYLCDACGEDFEEITSNADAHPECPFCGSKATHKLMSACSWSSNSVSTSHAASYAPVRSGCGGCSGGNCASCGR